MVHGSKINVPSFPLSLLPLLLLYNAEARKKEKNAPTLVLGCSESVWKSRYINRFGVMDVHNEQEGFDYRA